MMIRMMMITEDTEGGPKIGNGTVAANDDYDVGR